MNMQDLPLVGSIWSLLWIYFVYLAFVFKIGPSFMRNRKAYNLKSVLLAYNAIQVIGNFYCGVRCIYLVLSSTGSYDPGCMMPLSQDHPNYDDEVWHCYVYFLFKILDLLDTVFFVLRKSHKQITFLHIYHHTAILFGTFYLCHTNNFGGQAATTGILNHMVHGLMYTYYFLSALSPRVKESLWWKKYITISQLVQFAIILLQNSWTVLVREDCKYPFHLLYLITLNDIAMLILFTNFYVDNYVKKKDRKRVAESVDNTHKIEEDVMIKKDI